MISLKTLVIVLAININLIVGQGYNGDPCDFSRTNTKGICKHIAQCPEAISLLTKGVYPQKCGFEGTQPIVCCPHQITTTTNKTTTTTTNAATKATSKPVIQSRLPGEIANKKCQEYAHYVWQIELNPNLRNASDIRIITCPFNREQLIVGVGGEEAARREFTHMVQLGYEASEGTKWACGGSLISDQYVLSAAHCLTDKSLGDAKYARMGIVDLDDDDHKQTFDIIERIPHPDHAIPSHYNDIGLLKLHKKAALNRFVRPACLYTQPTTPYPDVIATGWGKTDFAGNESRHLLKMILEPFEHTKCNRTYRQHFGTNRLLEGIKDDLMICAGHSTKIRDTCQGDSGGPLQIYKDRLCMYEIIGITSFGKACGLGVNIPAVYTRVSHYVKWIEDIVWPLNK